MILTSERLKSSHINSEIDSKFLNFAWVSERVRKRSIFLFNAMLVKVTSICANDGGNSILRWLLKHLGQGKAKNSKEERCKQWAPVRDDRWRPRSLSRQAQSVSETIEEDDLMRIMWIMDYKANKYEHYSAEPYTLFRSQSSRMLTLFNPKWVGPERGSLCTAPFHFNDGIMRRWQDFTDLILKIRALWPSINRWNFFASNQSQFNNLAWARMRQALKIFRLW